VYYEYQNGLQQHPLFFFNLCRLESLILKTDSGQDQRYKVSKYKKFDQKVYSSVGVNLKTAARPLWHSRVPSYPSATVGAGTGAGHCNGPGTRKRSGN